MENQYPTPPKETLIQSTESWVNLSEETRDFIDNALQEQGHSNFRSQEAIFVESPEEDRFSQVLLALEYGLRSVTLTKIVATKELKNEPAGSTGITLKDDSFAIVFTKDNASSPDDYARSRNAQLEKANNLLETFGKPPLPTYTSQNREKV